LRVGREKRERERREGEYGMRMGSEEEWSFPGGSCCTI
jgi:hypothetical protein